MFDKVVTIMSKIIECIIYLALLLLIGYALYLFSKININTSNEAKDIGNIISVAAIFFTVLTVTISIMQFFKTKELDAFIDKNKKSFEEYNNAIKELDEKIVNCDKATKAALFYTYYLKTNEEYNTIGSSNYKEIIDGYLEALKIIKDNESNTIIKGYDKARMLRYLGEEYVCIHDYKNAEKYLTESLKYEEVPIDEIAKHHDLAFVKVKLRNVDEAVSLIEKMFFKYGQLAVNQYKSELTKQGTAMYNLKNTKSTSYSNEFFSKVEQLNKY